ncbi:MAG TPA: YraN family protein [Fimbriimonas sp.]|nr:YraN family protein [Fimbriimonas sp.]
MAKSKVELGREIEARAVAFLLELGYIIITRNYQIRGGEIDIVALDGDVLVFVEVRYRYDGTAFDSISPRKADALKRSARKYVMDMDENREYRIDFLAVDPNGIEHAIGFVE